MTLFLSLSLPLLVLAMHATCCAADATGFWRVEHQDNKSWFVDPAGQQTLITGVNWNSRGWDWHDNGTERFPHLEAMLAKHGSEEAVAQEDFRLLRSWGFNAVTLGRWGEQRHMDAVRPLHDAVQRSKAMPYTWLACFGYYFFDHRRIDERMIIWKAYAGLPDMFNPDFPAHCRRMAEEDAVRFRNDPMLLGHQIDNELQWVPAKDLIAAIMKKSYSVSNAKRELIRFLEQRLGHVDSLNQLCGTSLPDFQHLANHTTLNLPGEEGQRLADAFMEHAATTYFRITCAAIRAADPNHLILGTRDYKNFEPVVRAGGRYVDVWTMNHYLRLDPDLGIPANQIEQVKTIATWAQKPVMITEWNFSALDSKLNHTKGAGRVFFTQEQRARAFAMGQESFAAIPDVIGSMWFAYVDPPLVSSGRTFEDKNYGLIRSGGAVWPDITATATRVHRDLPRVHRSGAMPHVLPATLPQQQWSATLPPQVAADTALDNQRLRLHATAQGLEFLRGDAVVSILVPQIKRLADGRTDWPKNPSATVSTIYRDAHFIVADVVFRSDDWETTWRVWLPLETNDDWWAVQCLDVTNTSSQPFELVQILHAIFPPSDLVRFCTHYLGWQGWRVDSTHGESGLGGVIVTLDDRIYIDPWSDGDTSTKFHADYTFQIEQLLEPGSSSTRVPVTTVHAVYDAEHPELVPALLTRLRSHPAIVADTTGTETKNP